MTIVAKNQTDTAAVQKLAQNNLGELLTALGFSYTNKYNYLRMECPLHGGDNHTALAWSLQYGSWRCYSRGCADSLERRRDILDFVSLLLNMDRFAAANKILELLDGKKLRAVNGDNFVVDEEIKSF